MRPVNPDSHSLNNAGTCATCGAALVGVYCHRCGEKTVSSHDYSFSKFIEESADILTHYDSKLYRSVRLLISKPGYLTAEFFRGRRIPYVKPVQLFLLVNIFYFLAVSIFGWNTFATHLDIHLNNGYYGLLARSMVDGKLAQRTITFEEYRSMFDHMSTTLSKSLIFTMIPFMAFILQGLYWKPRRYYVENLYLSIHFFAFLLLYLVAVGLLLRLALIIPYLQSQRVLTTYGDAVGTGMIAVGTFIYLFLAFRRIRPQSAILIFMKAAIITYMSFWVLWVYRFILFVSCFYFS